MKKETRNKKETWKKKTSNLRNYLSIYNWFE